MIPLSVFEIEGGYPEHYGGGEEGEGEEEGLVLEYSRKLDAKEFSDVTLACGDGQLVEAHKVILAGSGHTSFGLSWGILSFILQFKICSILKIALFGYQHTSFAYAL